MHMCTLMCNTCVFPFRKYVFAGNWSPKGPFGVWSLHVHKVRQTAKGPTVTFLQALEAMLITDWISAGGDVLVKRRVIKRRLVSCCNALVRGWTISYTSWGASTRGITLFWYFLPCDAKLQHIIYRRHWHIIRDMHCRTERHIWVQREFF